MQPSNILYCSPAEKEAFLSLSDSLREGWAVKDETLTYTDTPKNREIRFMIARFHDPKLLKIKEGFKSVKSDEDFVKLMETIDLGAMSETDLGQIVFALGPDALSAFILATMKTVDTDSDLVMLANLSELRHELLESLTFVA